MLPHKRRIRLKNNSIISLLFGLGLLLVLVSFLFLKKWNETVIAGKVLAKSQDFQGSVSLVKKFETRKTEVSDSFSLYSLDSLETAGNGEALLDFPDGYRVRVLGGSLITLEEMGSQTLLILKQGNIQVENFGRDGSLLISHMGKKQSATAFQIEQQNKNTNSLTGTNPLPTKPLPSEKNVENNTGSLTQEDIQSTLQKHRPMFYKCYTQLLQKTPGMIGQVSLAFIIEKNGKISNPEISSSSINDPKFRSCLMEVLSRVNFKTFSGDPISTVFPLRFE